MSEAACHGSCSRSSGVRMVRSSRQACGVCACEARAVGLREAVSRRDVDRFNLGARGRVHGGAAAAVKGRARRDGQRLADRPPPMH